MRYRSIVPLGIVLLLLVSCGSITNSNNKAYPLQSKVGFHIGPAIHGDSRLSLFIWTMAGFHSACNRIDGTFWFHIAGRHIECSVEKLIEIGEGCSAVYTAAFDEWPIPVLPPGRYNFAMALHYGLAPPVEDEYIFDVITADSIIVTPVKADSSAYYAGEIDWWF